MGEPFYVKDCALAVISTGIAARSLSDFRERIVSVPISSLYFHFWGRHFRPAFDHPELHNDFARWAYLYLHDKTLSERLGIIDPTNYDHLENLRKAVLETIERRLSETSESTECYPKENQFHFLLSEIIVFKTPLIVPHPSELKNVLPNLTQSSLFFHFIDARRRTKEGIDDFSTWLKEQDGDHEELLRKIQHIDPFFPSLLEQKHKLIEIFNQNFS